jgi:hypothetical protein
MKLDILEIIIGLNLEYFFWRENYDYEWRRIIQNK